MQEERCSKTWKRILLCAVFSLLLHTVAAWAVFPLPAPDRPPRSRGDARRQILRVHRTTPPPMAKEQEADKQHPFAKTDPDSPERLPERTDYEGKRNSRAASAKDSASLQSPQNAPAMTGEESEETTTFNQERQDGDLAHDGKERHQQDAPRPTQPAKTESPQPEEQTAADTPDSADTDTPTPPRNTPVEDGLQILPAPTATQKSLGLETGTFPSDLVPPAPQERKKKTAQWDPAFADHAQPGFRTKERRSRSTGRFVLGSRAALNVSATPRGQYEAEIYRRIAYWWYRECDEHRGDIIPGKIVISIRLNTKGNLVNMDLVQRTGASVIQQSFTFGAIRQASLPAMPDNVRSEMVGDLLEMIFEFNFN